MTGYLPSLPAGYRAIVVGSTGAIGRAFVDALLGDPRCGGVVGLGRDTVPSVNYEDESSIAAAVSQLQDQSPFHLIIVATGTLHGPSRQPEKRLSELNFEHMLADFTINTIGPALVLAQFSRLLPKHERSLFAILSAKVGSIGDNRLGGWYSYRASKAALNMLIKTASIELSRTHPKAIVAALHPGTVNSTLSAPFRGSGVRREAPQAAQELLQVLDQLSTTQTGGFFAYDGQALPW